MAMQHVVFDTNLIVSSLISKHGFAFKIINELLIERKVILYISPDVLAEYKEVCSRSRFGKYPDFYINAERVTDFIELYAVIIHPEKHFSLLEDTDDNMYLDVAFAANAHYIVTGNHLHFTFEQFHNTMIVSPRTYWEKYKPA